MMWYVACYVAGFLVVPFFWSLSDGWPFAEARPDSDDVLFQILMCAFWPVVFFAALVYGWWCVASALGARARSLCGWAWKGFARWVRES